MSIESSAGGAKSASAAKPAALLQDQQDKQTWIVIGVLSAGIVLCYLNTLVPVFSAWQQPEYSHGWLIPLFAAVLLWLRREPFGEIATKDRWWGVGLVATGVVIRLAGTYFVTLSADRVSMIVCLLGIFVMVGGLRALRWAGPPIAFLLFMFPLPRVLVNNILRPLQSLATGTSLYALQTLGVEAYREGNRIMLNNIKMGVVEQCAGLRMLTIFLALATAVAMITATRPWWERLIVVASAIPIALTVNTIRITVTGLMYSLDVDEQIANWVFHDLAGWIMMPMALGLLYLEIQILSRLLVDVSPAEVMAGFPGGGGTPSSGRPARPVRAGAAVAAPRAIRGTPRAVSSAPRVVSRRKR